MRCTGHPRGPRLVPMRTSLTGSVTLCLVFLMGCGAKPAARAAESGAAAALQTCLPGGAGYLRATLRGAVNADLDWRDAEMSCEGSARPDGTGLRITIAGPLSTPGQPQPQRLRFVFGIDALGSGAADRAL